MRNSLTSFHQAESIREYLQEDEPLHPKKTS